LSACSPHYSFNKQMPPIPTF